MPTSNSRLIAHVRPTSSLHSPTVVMFVSRVTARHRAVNGFETLHKRASGQLRSMARAMPTVTGILRSARAMPPGPTLSPTGWGRPWAAGTVRSCVIASKPPTEYAVITNWAPARAASRSVVVVTSRPPPSEATWSATACTTGRLSGAVSMRTTSLSASGAVLTKSRSRRGVQCALPPPMMAIRGVMSPPTSPLLTLDVRTGVSPYLTGYGTWRAGVSRGSGPAG